MNEFNDTEIFSKSHGLAEAMKHELAAFALSQHLPFNAYRKSRLEFLSLQKNAETHAHFLSAFHPNIGVFAGSFNPFHLGHLNVLEKAERIFDKVIVAFGRNPDKSDDRDWKVPEGIKNRQIEEYHGLLTDFVAGLGHEVVVVRGLRNSTDFQYEQNQYRYIQELMPGIRIVNIFCDKEFEHISSSGIRTLEKFGRHHKYMLDE
jgi:pantetheine-phosphate adenylyltransferase